MKDELRVAFFASVCGIILAIVHLALRYGLDENSALEAIKVVGFLFFLLYTPLFINDYIIKNQKSELWLNPMLSLLGCLALGVLVGFLLRFFPASWPGWLFSACGSMLALWYSYKFVRTCTWVEFGIGLPLTLIFALSTTGMIYGSLAKPTFLEGLASYTPGAWHVDTLFHCSIAQMINTYGVPSIGLNGTPFMNYHFGSHFVLGMLSNLLDLDFLKFYIFASPVIFTCLFYYVLLLFTIQLKRFITSGVGDGRLGYFFWVLFFGILQGFIYRQWILDSSLNLENLVPGNLAASIILVSESYLMSIILFTILLSCILYRIQERKYSCDDHLFHFLILPCLIFVIALVKISTGFVALGLVFYLFFRYAHYKRTTSIIALLFSIALFFLAYKITNEGYTSTAEFFSFNFFKKNTTWFVIGFLLLQYFWCYVLILVFLVRMKIGSKAALLDCIANKKSILVEITLVIAAWGFVPMAMAELGTHGEFFTEIQFFVAATVLIAYLTTTDRLFFKHWIKPKIKQIVAIGLFLLFVQVFYSNGHYNVRFMIDGNFSFRKEAIGDHSNSVPRLDMTEFIREGKFSKLDSIVLVYGQPVQQALNKKKEYHFVKALRDLNNLPRQERAASLLHIDYKHSGLSLPIYCFEVVFLAPALAGIAQLNGMMTESDCILSAHGLERDYYGFWAYQFRTQADSEKLYSDEDLIKMTKSLGFNQLIIYRPDLGMFEKISCQ